eukprot:3647441-Lingulodinium_polyedra.AAC.1
MQAAARGGCYDAIPNSSKTRVLAARQASPSPALKAFASDARSLARRAAGAQSGVRRCFAL